MLRTGITFVRSYNSHFRPVHSLSGLEIQEFLQEKSSQKPVRSRVLNVNTNEMVGDEEIVAAKGVAFPRHPDYQGTNGFSDTEAEDKKL